MAFFFKKTKKKKELHVLRKKKTRRPLSTLQFQLIVGFVLMLLIAIMVTCVWYGTRIPSLQIAHIKVIGGQTIPHNVIEDRVDQALTGNYLHLIPKRFIPLYPKKSIVSSIKQLDRMKDVQVQMTSDQTLVVIFDEYIPYALWCQTKDSSECLFIDQQGYAFAQAPQLQGSAFVRYIADGVTPKLDTTGFDTSFMRDTKTFTQMLQDRLSLYVTYISQVDAYDTDYTLSGGGVLKVSNSLSIQTTFDNLKTILDSDQFSSLAPGTFDYIDLRFGDKIFLNDSPPGTATTTDAETAGTTTDASF